MTLCRKHKHSSEASALRCFIQAARRKSDRLYDFRPHFYAVLQPRWIKRGNFSLLVFQRDTWRGEK